VNDALFFSFSTLVGETISSQLDINAESTYKASFPLMGAIVGVASSNDNLNSGSLNYAYIQGTTHTDPGAEPQSNSNSYPAQENSESAIWTYNSVTNEITAQWVNVGGGKPTSYILYVTGSNALILTGDPGAFNDAFGSSPTVTFKLV